jgi:hypothetical protein
MALCSALINKSLRGGLVVVGGINLGGSIDPLHNAIDVVELAVEKGASATGRPCRSSPVQDFRPLVAGVQRSGSSTLALPKIILKIFEKS